MKRLTSLFIVILLLSAFPFPAKADNLAPTTGYLKQNVSSGSFQGFLDWAILALAGVDEDVSTLIHTREEQVRRGELFNSERSTDYQRTIIGTVAAGKEPRKFGGYDLVKAVKDSQLPSGKFADTITGRGVNLINAHIWGIISLYVAGEPVPGGNSALTWLVNHQNPDGGFSIDTAVKSSDIDMTGMALIAFAALGQDKGRPAVKKALNYLQSQQQEDGGFTSWGGSGVESITQVIQGLMMLGIDPAGPEWTRKSGNLLTALRSYRLRDGSFSQRPEGSSDIMSTYQGLMALGDYNRGESIYQVLRRKNLTFSDLPRWHYAHGDVRELVARKVISGYPDGTFRPDDPVKRQEFAVMIVLTIGKGGQVGPTMVRFNDLPRTHWANPFIKVAADLGLIKGKSISPPLFFPEDTISGAEVTAILVQASGKGSSAQASPGEPWHAGFVRVAREKGLLYPGFDPSKPANRAQCAYSLMRFVEQK